MKTIIDRILKILPYEWAKFMIIEFGKEVRTYDMDGDIFVYHELGNWCACPGDTPLYTSKAIRTLQRFKREIANALKEVCK